MSTRPVTAEGVEEEGEAKAEDGANEEEEKDELLPDVQVGVALVAEWLHVEDDCANHKGNESDQVSPDVSWRFNIEVWLETRKEFDKFDLHQNLTCLTVNPKDTLETLCETIQLGSVVKFDELGKSRNEKRKTCGRT